MKSEFSIPLTEYTLEEAVSNLIDYRGKTPKKTNYGIPLVTAKIVKNGRLEPYNEFIAEKDYESWMVRGIPKKGDIVLTVEAPLGEVAQLDDTKIALAQRIVTLRGKEDILDNTYFLYILQSSPMQSQLQSRASGTTVIGIKQSELRKIVLKLPPLPIQKKISHILSTLDDKIELNRKMNQTLESMASAIFKSWFVDFDPVHAKANCTNGAELENIAKKLGISKAILDLFPNEFEESELGMIPKGWEVVKIEEILKRYQAPKRYKKEAVESFGKTVVLEQGTNIILGYHDGEAEFQATEDEPMFIFGDHTCIMKLSTKPFSISENVIPLSGLIRNGYWTYYATYGQQTFQEYRRHWSELIVKEIVMSDKLLCDLFAKQVKPLILKIEQNILENNELAKTRDTLLPKLLSGEIDVSDLSLEME